MPLHWFRRSGSPIALVTLVAFSNATLASSLARAQSGSRAGASAPEHEATEASASYDDETRSALARHIGRKAAAPSTDGAAAAATAKGAAPAALPADVQTALAGLPTGGGISTQAASLPGGAATQLGMGESFTMQLSTGTPGYSIPLALHAARGRAQPSLALTYSAGAGAGIAGVGWALGTSAIVRQTDRGTPTYDDRSAWHPGQDRFAFGGMELVPICTVSGTSCTGALAGESMPDWANGWQYFRARVEGSFFRFFWSPDHQSWRVQAKNGTEMELGVPLDGSGYDGALERNPDKPSEVFGWHLVRQHDSQLSATSPRLPVNTVVYRYATDDAVVYPTDIFDTSPASNPTTTDLKTYAHHTTIAYEQRPDVAVSYRSGYPSRLRWRVSGVDVASKPFVGGPAAARELVRRYHLTYDRSAHRSLLTGVALEGRCSTAVAEGPDERLPSTTCPRLPAVSFDYQHVESSSSPPRDSAGLAFEPFDKTVRTLAASPPHSLDESDVGLVDVNGDGLPDVLATKPGLYTAKHGLYLNGVDGKLGFGQLTTMSVTPAGDVTDASVLALHSPTVAALDLDSDGIVNLVHMPQAKRYGVFSVAPDGAGGYQWKGRDVSTASQQSVKIDFTRNASNVRVMDVNGDGLVDVVYSSATELQTFFSLGRFPGGDGQFGSATWTGAATAQLSKSPSSLARPGAARWFASRMPTRTLRT